MILILILWSQQWFIASSNVLNVAVEQRDSVKFKASVRLTYDDESTSISFVVFNIDGHNVTAVKATGDFYTASWTPVVDDFNKEHTLKVTATASNKTAATDTYVFHLKCSGNACTNQLPKITLLNPTQTRINQSGGFRPRTYRCGCYRCGWLSKKCFC